MPMARGWFSGNTPLATRVVATGMDSNSASSLASSHASADRTPPPRFKTGFLALTSRSAALATASPSGAARCPGPTGSYSNEPSGTSVINTSLGISSTTGPGEPERRAVKARRMIDGMSSTLAIVPRHLTRVLNMSAETSCCTSLPS